MNLNSPRNIKNVASIDVNQVRNANLLGARNNRLMCSSNSIETSLEKFYKTEAGGWN